jgi:hypothetical protein
MWKTGNKLKSRASAFASFAFLCQSHSSSLLYPFIKFHFRFLASTVSMKMNFSVSPCDDFYQFSCGRFEKTTILPEDAGSVNTINLIEGRVMAQLHTLLNSEIHDNEIKPFKMAKTIFRQCMNQCKFFFLLQVHNR